MRETDIRREFFRRTQDVIDGRSQIEDLEEWEASYFQYFAALPEGDPIGDLWAELQECIVERNLSLRDDEQCRAALIKALSTNVPG